MNPWLVWPPIFAAALVLMSAAVAVDFFGVSRLRGQWLGFATDYRAAWTRARNLENQFFILKKKGSPRTRVVARSLLLAYAEADRLSEARAVVDFLGADAVFSEFGTDALADGLRAIALAELGRLDEAEVVLEKLTTDRRHKRRAVVSYAAARVAEVAGRKHEALEHTRVGLTRPTTRAAKRDLRLLEARLLAAIARVEESTVIFAELVGLGFRSEVEAETERAHEVGQVAVVMAARSALCDAVPYR